MSANENGNLRPDGISISLPAFLGRVGGAYYWNPGSATAPNVTFTRTLGMPGAGLNAVFLRHGMTSQDTLGSGVSGNVSTIVPSVTLNGTIPDQGYQPWNSRATSVEAGIGTPNASPSITNTYSLQQVLDFLKKYVLRPAGGPNDELSSIQQSLQSGVTTIGPSIAPPQVGLFDAPSQNPFGNGIGSWPSSVNPTSPFYAAPPADQPGGLTGMLLDYLHHNQRSTQASPTQAAAASQLPDASQELPPLQPDETQGAADNRPQRFLGRRTYSLSDPSPLPQRSSLAAPMSPDGPLSINEAYEYLKRLNASLA